MAEPAERIPARPLPGRSRQIDIAIFDRLYSPLLFPHPSGLHIPAESVYAVLEVKQILTRQLLGDAALKAASVRNLRRTSVPVVAAGRPRRAIAPSRILVGVLALTSNWDARFQVKMTDTLSSLAPVARLDLGCVLDRGAFEVLPGRRPRFCFSAPSEFLLFFVLRLLERLRSMGTAPAADLMSYTRSLRSFRSPPGRDPS